MQHTVFLFDGYQLDVTRRKLVSAGGVTLPLPSRAMEALLLLVANAGQVIDRRRLMQTIWPNTIVEDNNLNQCIRVIRRALGETAGSNRFVMTVPGRGFCFVCPVRQRIQESPEEEISVSVTAPTAPASSPNPQIPQPRSTSLAAASSRYVVQRSFWCGLLIGTALGAVLLLPFAWHASG